MFVSILQHFKSLLVRISVFVSLSQCLSVIAGLTSFHSTCQHSTVFVSHCWSAFHISILVFVIRSLSEFHSVCQYSTVFVSHCWSIFHSVCQSLLVSIPQFLSVIASQHFMMLVSHCQSVFHSVCQSLLVSIPQFLSVITGKHFSVCQSLPVSISWCFQSLLVSILHAVFVSHCVTAFHSV